MVKNDLECFILKFTEPLQRYLLTCQANSALLGRFFCTGQQQLWKPLWNFKIIFSRPLFTTIFKPKMIILRLKILELFCILFYRLFLGLKRQKRPKRPKKSSMKRRLHCLKVILWSIKEKWKKRKGFIKPGKPCLPLWNRRKKKKRRSRPGKYCKIHNMYTVWTVKSVIFSFTCSNSFWSYTCAI